MNVVTTDDVKKVARLARLQLSDSELAMFVGQLNDILTYVQQLQAIPTDQVPPTSHPLPLTNVMRDDHPGVSLPPDAVTAIAPSAHGVCYKVPKIIDT